MKFNKSLILIALLIICLCLYSCNYLRWYWIHEDAIDELNYGNLDESERIFKQSISFARKNYGSENVYSAISMMGLSLVYHEQDKLQTANDVFDQALKTFNKTVAIDNDLLIDELTEIGRYLYYQDRYSHSAEIFKSLSIIHENCSGYNSLDHAYCLEELAGIYRSWGKYTEAESVNINVKDILDNCPDANALDRAKAFNNLGMNYADLDKFEPAESLQFMALKEIEEASLTDHPNYAFYIINLAYIYQKQGIYEGIDTLYEKAIKIRKNSFGESSEEYVEALDYLAELYKDTEKYNEAESLFLEILSINENNLGSDHPALEPIYRRLAGIYIRTNRTNDAQKYNEKAAAIRTKYSYDSLYVQ
jgi:tetratricopeptide (TPR) repeat protein